ncbi:MAG: dTDP-4-dehydrorhamnose reductase [Pseudomonas citronellolis]|nr:MAG: dTDP-4-dehydrorhamnose reductase [Pseudomonas citronellolis]
MRVLLVGARGFIGRHLMPALLAAGHEVVATARRPPATSDIPGLRWQALDLTQPEAFEWPAAIDVLINAAGALSDDQALLHATQALGPQALFQSAAAHGARILQVSALGAGNQADVPFLTSKAQADQAALAQPSAVVLRPSLVIGPGGASSEWLARLAALPLVPVWSRTARLQPVHIDDLLGAILALLRQWPSENRVFDVVGPQALTQAQLIGLLGQAQGRQPPRALGIPRLLGRVLAPLARRWDWPVCSGQLSRMARRDNLGDPEPLVEAVGYRPLALASRLHTWPRAGETSSAWLRPAALAVLALIWLGTALVCLGPGFDWGLRIMAEFGVEGWRASLAVVAGALLDGLLGIGLLRRRWRRRALHAQIALMLVYMLLISLRLPYYWADPFMAVGKNLPILLLSLWLLAGEPRGGKDAE